MRVLKPKTRRVAALYPFTSLATLINSIQPLIELEVGVFTNFEIWSRLRHLLCAGNAFTTKPKADTSKADTSKAGTTLSRSAEERLPPRDRSTLQTLFVEGSTTSEAQGEGRH